MRIKLKVCIKELFPLNDRPNSLLIFVLHRFCVTVTLLRIALPYMTM